MNTFFTLYTLWLLEKAFQILFIPYLIGFIAAALIQLIILSKYEEFGAFSTHARIFLFSLCWPCLIFLWFIHRYVMKIIAFDRETQYRNLMEKFRETTQNPETDVNNNNNDNS